MIAAKFNDDSFYNNAYYANIGGVPTTELNTLEVELLFSIDFNILVNNDVFDRYLGELNAHVASATRCQCNAYHVRVPMAVQDNVI